MMNELELKAADLLIEIALKEDIGTGDITTDNLIPADKRMIAKMIAKAEGVIAGLEVAERVFRQLDNNLRWDVIKSDGEKVIKGDTIVRFEATYRALLTGERTALNFLQRMSGIATSSSILHNEIKEFKTEVLDTRKTLPGFRLLDKYAVRTGGCSNHRFGLYDMVMIKDNHIEVAGGITNAINAIRAKIDKNIIVEVETTNLKEVEEAVNAGADIILLDNMSIETIYQSVSLINGRAKTEASGNMTLERLREVAETGVDYISLGILTHSVTALDISQRISEIEN